MKDKKGIIEDMVETPNRREIKFRGYDRHSKEWIYGCLDLYGHGKPVIIVDPRRDLVYGARFVDINTIGQFMCRNQEQEIDIYEGDVVIMHQLLFDGQEIECETLGVIEFIDFSFHLTKIESNKLEKYSGFCRSEGFFSCENFASLDGAHGIDADSFTVIGNIYDNPELLGEKQQ